MSTTRKPEVTSEPEELIDTSQMSVGKREALDLAEASREAMAVSYTHLTLPTIYSV